MDKERFLETARRGTTTLEDLLSMRRNAIVRNHIEYVNLAERVLDERFPTWRKVISKPGGKTPTDVKVVGLKPDPQPGASWVGLQSDGFRGM